MGKGILIRFGYGILQTGLLVMSVIGLSWIIKGVDNNHIGLGIALFIAVMLLAMLIAAIAWEAYQ